MQALDSPPEGRSGDPDVRVATAILQELFGAHFVENFAIEFWDGSRLPARNAEEFCLKITDPGALRLAFVPPIDLNAGRAFAAGLLDVEGDIEAAVDTLYLCMQKFSKFKGPLLLARLLRLPKRNFPALREAHLHGKIHSAQRDRVAIGFHYDQPVEFYRTFLGSELVYSCAYFDEGIEDVESAQLAKLDYVLRKLRVQPGERLLDIGCGWGALVIRAAQKFGVKAVGITLSRQQFEEAQRRISAAGLQGQASVELQDYREVGAATFDKIASVGMVEHVGRDRLKEYFSKAFSILRRGGLFLNHGIAEQSPGRTGGKVTGFIERFVFPDGELVSISDSLQFAERTGFEVRDVENLREHYMRTLRAWVKNLENAKDHAVEEAGAQAYRTWRLYMAGSAQGFRIGRMGLFQSLLAKPNNDGSIGDLPATRRDLYQTVR
ncbi:MAG: cyclopropane-fatty-acyl-phospholipid synthase family protein [Candidatus Eremiobacteraeota bacterium]|nr:cyclopropane-fatty-acyl-phospholipid synthase family protein [Candidatus Eremiobacteraeota bacterium]